MNQSRYRMAHTFPPDTVSCRKWIAELEQRPELLGSIDTPFELPANDAGSGAGCRHRSATVRISWEGFQASADAPRHWHAVSRGEGSPYLSCVSPGRGEPVFVSGGPAASNAHCGGAPWGGVQHRNRRLECSQLDGKPCTRYHNAMVMLLGDHVARRCR